MTPRRAVVELELISRIDQDGDCTETRTFARGELTRLRDSVTLAYREPDGDSRTQIRLSENGQALIHRTGEFSGRIPGNGQSFSITLPTATWNWPVKGWNCCSGKKTPLDSWCCVTASAHRTAILSVKITSPSYIRRVQIK